MPIYNGTYTETITNGGGTINLDVNDSTITRYVFDGTPTLTASVTIQPTGAPVEGMEFDIRWQAVCALNGNSVTIFGTALTAAQALMDLQILAYYNGAAWDVDIQSDGVADNSVTNAKLATMQPLTIKGNNTNGSANPTDIFAAANTVLKRNNANAIVFDSVRRLDLETATNSATGVGLGNIQHIADQRILGNISGISAIPAELTSAQVQTFLGLSPTTLLETNITISAASVLTLNSAPITVIPAPGVDKLIEVVSATCFIDFGTIAYATNTELRLTFNTASGDSVTRNTGVLAVTTDKIFKLGFVTTTGTAAQMLLNTNLVLFVTAGDPTAGDSPLKLRILYRILDLS